MGLIRDKSLTLLPAYAHPPAPASVAPQQLQWSAATMLPKPPPPCVQSGPVSSPEPVIEHHAPTPFGCRR